MQNIVPAVEGVTDIKEQEFISLLQSHPECLFGEKKLRAILNDLFPRDVQMNNILVNLFHLGLPREIGMRISEFCGLTIQDINLDRRTINIDHQLQRTSDMQYIIVNSAKTDAGTRILPMERGKSRKLSQWWMEGLASFTWIRMGCPWWRCTGKSIFSTSLRSTKRSTGCRYPRSRPMYAGIPTAARRPRRE